MADQAKAAAKVVQEKAQQVKEATDAYISSSGATTIQEKAKYIAADLADDGKLNNSVTMEQANAFTAKDAGNAMGQGASNLFGQLKAMAGSAIATVSSAAEPYATKAKEFTQTELEKAKETLGHVKDGAVDTYHQVAEKVTETSNAALDKAAPVVAKGIRSASPALEKVKGVAQDLLHQAEPTIAKVKETVDPLVGKAKDVAQPYVDKVKETVDPLVDKAKDAAQPYVEKAKEITAPAVASVKETVNKVQGAVQDELVKLDGGFDKNILLICTSHGDLGHTDKKTGVWLEEIASPYLAFKKAGCKVTVASVKGGKIPVDEASLADGALTLETREFQADSEAMDTLENSIALDSIDDDASGYDAIFLPGGHGTVFDLPKNTKLQTILSKAYERGAVIGAVCHGPVGLVNVKVDGKPLVQGKKVTGFTNSEEAAVGLTNVVPFLLENKLKDLGGNYSAGPNWAPYAVRDGRLITGQNPASSGAAAKEVLLALK